MNGLINYLKMPGRRPGGFNSISLMKISFLLILILVLKAGAAAEMSDDGVPATADRDSADKVSADEVAIGYTSLKRINFTGSVTTVRSQDLTVVPVPQTGHMLMGRTPGLFIKNKKGQPGEDGIDINIRGFGTPIVIVDGMPVTISYFQQLEPWDIESLDVLKDAFALAVYGASGGNGAIIVNTKRGVEGAPRFSYNGNYSLQFFTFRLDQAGSPEYAAMFNVAYMNEQRPPRWTDDEIMKFRDGSDPLNYPNTNWWRESLRDFAPQHKHGLSVRGGSGKVKYYTGVSIFDQKGFHVSDDTGYSRFTLRSNIDFKLTENFNAGLDLSFTNQDYLGSSLKLERTSLDGIMSRIWRSRPFAANLPLPDPTKVPAMVSGATVNPYYMGFIEHAGFNDWERLYGFGKLKIDYDLSYGFRAQAGFDINRNYYDDRLRVLEMPSYDYDSGTDQYILRRRLSAYSYLKEQNSTFKNFNQQYFLTWNDMMGDHGLNALFGFERLSDHYEYSDDFHIDQGYQAAQDINYDNSSFRRKGIRKAFIGMINYNFREKYLFGFSGRADGSPQFPPDKPWGYFPAFSMGWRISEEPFFSEKIPVVSNLKLRASHGMLGYDIRLHQINQVTSTNPGNWPEVLPNPNITWETMIITNSGIDFSFGEFLTGSMDYFYRLRTNVLGIPVRDIPDVVGARLPPESYREYDNRGWEFSLFHKNGAGELRYSIGGNISINREKTLYLDQETFGSREVWRRNNQIGEWAERFWAYPVDGLFLSWEDIHNLDYDIDGQGNRTISPGDIKYIDYNGDGRIDASDMIVAGRGAMPGLMYGIDVSISWRNFDFMMLWQGAGLYNYNLRAGGRDFVMPFYSENSPTMFMYENMYTDENPWMPANTTGALWPRFGSDLYNRTHTNYNRDNQLWLASGNYVRLKNIQIGYTLPQRMTERWNINNLKVFLSGYNVFTISEYPFLDPEIDTSPAHTFGMYHPVVGIYNLGVQIDI
jgi:TonB-linked SusC/RagA family outer membrane protein